MLVTAPRLRIRRPSPTTAEFSVTTSPPLTLPLRLLRLLLLLTRILLAFAALLLLHARWVVASSSSSSARQIASSAPPPPFLSLDHALHLLDSFSRTTPGLALQTISLASPLPVLLAAVAALFYVLSLRVHTTEGLLVLRGLGVQTSESPGSYLAGTATRFIPTEKIQDVLINEAFRGFEVRYYLVVVVDGEEDVVVVFPGLLPNREIVETVWRGVRECLYEKKGREDGKAGGGGGQAV